MEYQITDYNGANKLFGNGLAQEWKEIKETVETSKIHLKASDQRGKVGSAIFDPVGTNQTFKDLLTAKDWKGNLNIPLEFRFLGKGVDFEKNGIIIEVQFSNYPFLLNNIFRSELFNKSNTVFDKKPTNSLVIITKSGKFASSNSTLYYEQAKKQLDSFSKYKSFDVPIRLVGLFANNDADNEVVWTEYESARYSRTIENQSTKNMFVSELGRRYVFTDK